MVLRPVAQVSLMLAVLLPMMSNFVHVLQGSGNGPGSTDLSALVVVVKLYMFSQMLQDPKFGYMIFDFQICLFTSSIIKAFTELL